MTRDQDDGLPRWPVLEDEIGEDPSRFLRYSSAFALARIRGIDRIDVARRWIECELEIGEYREDGPRSAVIGELNRRIEYLREHGERDEQLQHRREVKDRDVDVVFVDEDGQEYTPEEWDRKRGDPLDRLGSSSETIEAATDGGSDR